MMQQNHFPDQMKWAIFQKITEGLPQINFSVETFSKQSGFNILNSGEARNQIRLIKNNILILSVEPSYAYMTYFVIQPFMKYIFEQSTAFTSALQVY